MTRLATRILRSPLAAAPLTLAAAVSAHAGGTCAPELIKAIGGAATDVEVVGDAAFVTFGSGGLAVFDITNPESPVILDRLDTPGEAGDVVISGDYAYVADSASGFAVIDVSAPADLTLVESRVLPRPALGVAVSAGSLFIANEADGLRIFSLADPTDPAFTALFDTPGIALDLAVDAGFAYVADDLQALKIIDVSVPASPALVSTYDPGSFDVINVVLEGTIAYVCAAEQPSAQTGGRMFIVDISNPASPVQIGQASASDVPDVAIDGDVAYIMAENSTLDVYDISDPVNPTFIPQSQSNFSGSGVEIVGDTLLIAGRGFRALDIADPGNITTLSTYALPRFAQDVAIVGDIAAVADGFSGVKFIDISDPDNPALIGSVESENRAYEIAFDGSYAYAAVDFFGIQVIDASDPANPQTVTYLDTGSPRGLDLVGSTLYVADFSQLVVVDVSTPALPAILGSVLTPSLPQGVSVVGDTAYLADASSGLQVIDVSNPAAPTIVGNYDNTNFNFNARHVVADGDFAYVTLTAGSVQVVDVSDPMNPDGVILFDAGPDVRRAQVVGDRLLLARESGGLVIADIANPAAPSVIATYTESAPSRGVAEKDGVAYIASTTDGVIAVDIDGCLTGNPADLDGDGSVGSGDLGVLLAAWGSAGGPADLDGDGIVGSGDLGILLAAWGS